MKVNLRKKFEAAAQGRVMLPFLSIGTAPTEPIIARHVGDADPADILFLTEICKDAPDQFVRQLVMRDDVHQEGVESIERLRELRLGGDGYSKTVYAIMDGKGELYSAIYVQKGYVPLENHEELAGDIRAILEEPAVLTIDNPESMIFYSITNMVHKTKEGAAEILIRQLHPYLTENFKAVLSTLSPCRTFEDYALETGLDISAIKDSDVLRAHVVKYLMQKANPVQRFHMGNGAYPGDIKIGGGDRSVKKGTNSIMTHVAMINYVYDPDPEVLASNASAFKRGDFAHLLPSLGLHA